jgi:hypothetical protein
MKIDNKYILFLIAFAGILYGFITTYGYTMDDALITLRYSINFADSGLPIWNKADFSHPTMGFTSPLWMLINSIQAHFTSDKDLIIIFSKYWSLSVLMGFTWLIVSIINKQKITFFTKILFTVLLLWNPVMAFHASSGMETILFATAIGFYAVLAIRFSDHYKTMTALGLLLFFIRPEGILALGIYWLFDLIKNRDFKKSIISSIVILFILGIYFWSIYSYYGYPLPSAFYVKQGGSHIIKMAAVKMTVLFLFLSALPLIALLFSVRKNIIINSEKNLFIIALIVIYLLFYLTVEPLMNVVYRYQLPILFLLMVMVSNNLEAFWRQKAYVRYGIIGLWVLLLIFNVGYTNKYTTKVSQASENLKEIGLFLKQHNNFNDWLMYHDAGYVCYYSDFNSIDSIGLNTIDIAVKSKTKEEYLKEKNLKYYLQNGRTHSLENIETEDKVQEFGFDYVGSIPISYDGAEYYIVKLYQREGNIKPEDLKKLSLNLEIRKTWFDKVYYFGRKLIKNR